MDEKLTRKLKSAGEFLDIFFLDHLILTSDAYYSYADEENRLEKYFPKNAYSKCPNVRPRNPNVRHFTILDFIENKNMCALKNGINF